MSVEQRQRVVEEAYKWLRTPYHHRGRVRGAGVDCAMLPAEVYHACGLIPHLEPEHYPIDWALHRSDERYLGWVTQHAHRVEAPGLGDLVLFKVGRCFSHSAIIVGWPTIIHAMTKEGVVLDDAQRNSRLTMNKDGSPREHAFFSLWND